MKIPKSLNDNILYLAGEVARRVHNNISTKFTEQGFDVTVEQFGVLALLWYKEGVKQQGIADGLNRDKTTITRVVQNMINRKLIVKILDKLDRRNNLIYLTKEGKELQRDMVESAGEVYNKALKDIPDEEVVLCLKVLNQVMGNLR